MIGVKLLTYRHTFEVAPVFVLLTHYMVKRLCDLAGYQDGDGIFTAGTSLDFYKSNIR